MDSSDKHLSSFEGVGSAIRSIRTTTFAGLLWAIALWLAVGEQFDATDRGVEEQASGVDRLVDLFDALGDIGAAIAFSLLIFLLGAVSQQVFRAPAIWTMNLAGVLVQVTERGAASVIGHFRKVQVIRRYDAWRPAAVDLARRILDEYLVEIRQRAATELEFASLRQEVYAALDKEIRLELESPDRSATYLRRLDDQATVRLSLVFPTFALIAALAWRVEPLFALALPAAMVLAFQAMEDRWMRDDELSSAVWARVADAFALQPRR